MVGPIDRGHTPFAKHLFQDVAPAQRGPHAGIFHAFQLRPVDEAVQTPVRILEFALRTDQHRQDPRLSSPSEPRFPSFYAHYRALCRVASGDFVLARTAEAADAPGFPSARDVLRADELTGVDTP